MDNVIDGHIHFEHQPYTLEIVDNMVRVAQERGVTELHLLDHTHKFEEFAFLYNMDSLDPSCIEMFKKHKFIPIKEYIDFIKVVRSKKYPIKIKFGLEVCYFKQYENRLKEELSKYDFDFLIGSTHYIDGFGYDFGAELWVGRDVDHLWKRYYEITFDLIKSKLFTQLAHPDALKIYGYMPSFSLDDYYRKVAKLLKEYDVATENNTGFSRYGFTNYGLDKTFLRILKEEGVKLVKSSDAHKYADIGNKFDEVTI